MILKRCLCGGKAELDYQYSFESERKGIPGYVVTCEKCGEHNGVWSCFMPSGLMIRQARREWNRGVRYRKKMSRIRKREEWYIKRCTGRFGKGKTLSLFERMEFESKMSNKNKTQ